MFHVGHICKPLFSNGSYLDGINKRWLVVDLCADRTSVVHESLTQTLSSLKPDLRIHELIYGYLPTIEFTKTTVKGYVPYIEVTVSSFK